MEKTAIVDAVEIAIAEAGESSCAYLAGAAVDAMAPFLSVWQPIETAPKMGGILLYVTVGVEREGELLGSTYACGFWDEVEDRWQTITSGDKGPFLNPSHWMPLPPPPAGYGPGLFPPPEGTDEGLTWGGPTIVTKEGYLQRSGPEG